MSWWQTGWALLARTVANLRMDPPALVGAVLFVCLSLTPSLLPRTWLAQGVISGLAGAIGYGLGALLAWVYRLATRGRLRPPERWRVPLRIAVASATSALLALSLYYGSVWQRSLYTLIGEPPPGRLGYVRVLLVTGLVAGTAVGAARLVRAFARWVIGVTGRLVPPVPARIAGITVVGLLAVVVFDGVVHDGFLYVATSTSASINDHVSAAAPTSALRSGSPRSLVSWDSLGREGREFVTGGPTTAQLSAFTGSPATEPIRVYVGLKSAPDSTVAAGLAVRELRRTGAFERSVLCVVTTTGTGWIDPYIAAALEYMHGGDTAIVGTQFSYLPSWISYLTERERVAQAGRALFDQVYAYWATLPAEHRPRLVVFGESLGSLGAESAFRDLADVRQRTDGVLWVGPTNENPLWRQLVARRDAGSTEVLPVYGGGEVVRFASRPEDLTRPAGPWPAPRVVYLQNPSDPVTWWSPRLLYAQPDWLAEPRGYDVQPAMRWYPLVTFLQVTADLALAQRTPGAHGHYFHGAAVAAWAAVMPPVDWSDARTVALSRLLDGA